MTYGDYKAFLEGAKLYKKPFDVSGIGRVYEYKDTAFATFNELKGRKDLGVVDKIYFATDSCEPDAYLGMFTNVKDLRIFRAPQCKNIPWASGLSKAEIVKLSETEVEDVSWLRNMRELK